MKRAGQIALGLGLGAGILVIAAKLMGVSREALLAAIYGLPLWIAPASAVALFLLFALGALRWNGSMQPVLNNTFWQGYWAMLVTYPFNSILPAKGGDLVRVNLLSVRTGVSRVTILGAEIMDKGMDLCGPLPVIALLLVFGQVPAWVMSGVSLIAGVLVLLILFMVGMRSRGFSQTHWLGRALAKLRQAYVGRRPRALLTTALLFAPLPWIGEAAALYVVGNGSGIPLTAVQAFFVLVAVKVGMAVPTPGGIGSVEAAGAAALVFFGAAPAQALALMLIYRTSQLAAGSLIGAASLSAPMGFESNALPATPE
ncbi:MAG: hypothetical protein H6Q89_1472 [Myxococcaceae bacterium]|nr:hypothetical protein [Myxococcaceae bacterium]